MLVLVGCVSRVSAQAPPVAPALAFEVASVRATTGSDGSIPFPATPPDAIILINHPLESIIRYATTG
jgi:hypothetical protein